MASCSAGMSGATGALAQGRNSARANGYVMPEETEPHVRTFMQWPVNRTVYRDHVFLEMVQQTIADIANTIAQFEPVVMLADKSHHNKMRKMLGTGIELWDIATDDLWCRDAGPVFVKNKAGKLAVTQVNFNGWGNKQVHDNDGTIAAKIAKRVGLEVFNNGIVGEAGGVESDGNGTLIAHESSWVNPNRNSDSREEIGIKMMETFGAEKMIWAPGIKGADITDYHIDSLARFVEPGRVVIQMPEKIDQRDLWSVAAFETYDILEKATDASGNRLELIIIPDPYDIRITSDDFVSSYVNYYVCNGAVIVAEFGDKETDEKAASTLKSLYRGREIVTLNIDPVGEVGGGIHCATQQQPV